MQKAKSQSLIPQPFKLNSCKRLFYFLIAFIRLISFALTSFTLLLNGAKTPLLMNPRSKTIKLMIRSIPAHVQSREQYPESEQNPCRNFFRNPLLCSGVWSMRLF